MVSEVVQLTACQMPRPPFIGFRGLPHKLPEVQARVTQAVALFSQETFLCQEADCPGQVSLVPPISMNRKSSTPGFNKDRTLKRR